MVDVFERTIGVPYPYERYSQIAVADFLFGGMENTTATTQTDRVLHDERAHLDYSADYLASHELAHQWFGDLVTCRDWSQAWLNEGFATYFESVWLEAHLGWDEYAVRRLHDRAALSRRGRRALSPPDRVQPVPRSGRAVRPPPLREGRRRAAHAARRARLGAHEARAQALRHRTTRGATSRRST